MQCLVDLQRFETSFTDHYFTEGQVYANEARDAARSYLTSLALASAFLPSLTTVHSGGITFIPGISAHLAGMQSWVDGDVDWPDKVL